MIKADNHFGIVLREGKHLKDDHKDIFEKTYAIVMVLLFVSNFSYLSALDLQPVREDLSGWNNNS